MADAMLFEKDKVSKSAESEDSGKKTTRKSSSKSEKKETTKRQKGFEVSPPRISSKDGKETGMTGGGYTSVTSNKASNSKANKDNIEPEGSTETIKSNEVTLSDVMNCLKDMKKDQIKSNNRLDVLASKVNEMYDNDYDEDDLLYGDDETEGLNDENNNDEPPAKRRRVVDVEVHADQNGNTARSNGAKNNENTPKDDENSSKPESRGNFKDLVEKYKVRDKVDKAVNSDLADLVNNFFQNGLPDDQVSELLKNIDRPENCPMLKKTRVNQLIWDLLSDYTRAEENRVQYRQGLVVNAGILLTKLVNTLNECKNKEGDDFPFQDMINLGTDALGLLGHWNRSTNLARRDYQRPDLSDEYYHLCSSTVPYTEFLYGDDISKKVSDIDSINKIGRKVRRGRGFGYRFGRRRFGRLAARRGGRGRGDPRGYKRIRDQYDDRDSGRGEGSQNVSRYDPPKNSRRGFGRRGRY